MMGKTILETSNDYIEKQYLEKKQTGNIPDWWEGVTTISSNAITDIDKELKELRHFKDSLCGLYATDKIPTDLFKIIFSDMIVEIGMDGEKTFSAKDFEYYEIYFNKGIKKLMYQITSTKDIKTLPEAIQRDTVK